MHHCCLPLPSHHCCHPLLPHGLPALPTTIAHRPATHLANGDTAQGGQAGIVPLLCDGLRPKGPDQAGEGEPFLCHSIGCRQRILVDALGAAGEGAVGACYQHERGAHCGGCACHLRRQAPEVEGSSNLWMGGVPGRDAGGWGGAVQGAGGRSRCPKSSSSCTAQAESCTNCTAPTAAACWQQPQQAARHRANSPLAASCGWPR